MNVRDRAHLPGLEALRALAVCAVVLFHAEVSWLPGGYLGVSLFFTVSGFLITRNLLVEHERTGEVSVRSFWGRRARRLIPASWATIAVVVLASVTVPAFGRSVRFEAGDTIAALTSVANWRFVASGSSYAALFAAPSAFLHFWSLAIEEQVYLVLPVLVLLAARSRRPARLVLLGGAFAAAVSFLLPVVVDVSVDRAYYGTDTRLGEIAIGVVLAAALHLRPLRLPSWTGLAALAALGLLCTQVAEGSPTITRGLLPLVAVLSTLSVWSAIGHGALHRIGSWPVVAWVGRASYGIYLFHWPWILVLRYLGMPMGTWGAVIAVIAPAGVFAALSLRWLEMPVRSRRWPTRNLLLAGAAAVTLIVAVSAVGAPGPSRSDELLASLDPGLAAITQRPSDSSPPPPSSSPTAAATGAGSTLTTAPTVSGPPISTSEATAPSAPTMRFFGDSILLTLLLALPPDAGLVPTPVDGDLRLGCGLVAFDEPADSGPIVSCDDPAGAWTASLRASPVDAAVVMSCQWEAVARAIPGSGGSDDRLVAGDAALDRYVEESYGRVVDALLAGGVRAVLWIPCPHHSQVVGVDGLDPRLVASRDPQRVDALDEIVATVAARHRGAVCIVDLASWVDARVDDAALRPDGSHFEWREPTGVGPVFAGRLLDAWSRCSGP